MKVKRFKNLRRC